MSNIKLYVASVDVWPITRLGARFTYKAQNGNPGSCSFTIRDEFSNLTYDVGSRIRLEVDGQNVWAGYITSVQYSFFASVFPTIGAYAEEHGVDRALVIEGVDLNYLFQKRCIYNQNKPEEPYGPKYEADTPDKVVLKKLFDEWIDLSGDNINTSARVEQVGTIGLFEKGRPFRTASSWGDTMRTVSRIAGAVYYIDPDRNFVYTDVDTVSSPLVLTDTPDPADPDEIGYRDLEILRDATNMVNHFHLWSQTLGVNKTMYTKSKSHDSIREHGLWQAGELTNSLYHKEYLDARARTFVYGSPQNKRGAKDDRISVKATVFNQSITAGEKYRFVSNVFGYEDVLPAREVNISFPTPTDVQYDITLSHEIDDPWSFFETYWPPLDPPQLPDGESPPRIVSGPEIVRVLDSFSRTQMPTQNYDGPINNPGWGQGEQLNWQTPQHPSNAYFVSGGYGSLGSIGPFYRGVDDPTFNEVYADYPDNSPDLRNLLIKFRLGRYRRIYESEGERAYNPDGTALGIQNPEFVFDVIDDARHFPDVATSAVIPIGSPSATFSANPVVPPGGQVTHTIACGNLGFPMDPDNPWYAGESTGAGLIPAYMRLEGASTREGVGPIEIPEPSAADLTVSSYVFAGRDVPGMTYPWDVNFWVETFGHRLTFSRTSSLASFAGGTSTKSFWMKYALQTDSWVGRTTLPSLYGIPLRITSDPGTKPLPVDLVQLFFALTASFINDTAIYIPPWDPGTEPFYIMHNSRTVPLLDVVQHDQPVFSINAYEGGQFPHPFDSISTIVQDSPHGHWRWQYRSETQTWRLAFHEGPDPYYGLSPDQLLQGAPDDTYNGLPRLSFDAAPPGSGMIGPEVIVDVYLGDPFQTNIWPAVSGYREGPPADWPSINPSELQPDRPVPLYPDSTQPTGEGYAIRWITTSGYVDSSPFSEAFLQPDTDYLLRIVQDANGSMHARLWSAGEAEPDTWYFVKKNISAPFGFGGYSDAEPTSIGPNGIRLGTTVFPFQSYTVDFDFIATATNTEGDTVPQTSVKVCESAAPRIDAGSDRAYWFVTKRPYIPDTVSSLTIFGIEQQKGTHFTEADPSQGLLYVMAGVSLKDLGEGGDTSVIACYYTEQLETSDGPSLGKLRIR